MHKIGLESRRLPGKVVGSKYVCDAAGTGTKADQSVETIRGA